MEAPQAIAKPGLQGAMLKRKKNSVGAMEVGTRGTKGARAPYFSKSRAKCPFSCNLLALREVSEDAKITIKYTFPAVLEGLGLKIFPGKYAPNP